MRRRLVLLIVSCSLLAAVARAETQQELLQRAEQAETRLNYAAALEDYRKSLDSEPGSRLARRARARWEFLEAHREGGFGPLVELENMRRSAPDRAALAAFSQRIDAFPPGPVRREARALVAETLSERLALPAEAVGAYQRWLEEPGLDDADFVRATHGLARCRARLGDLGRALETLRAAGLGRSEEAIGIELLQVRRWAQPLAWALVCAFAFLAIAWGGLRALVPAKLRALVTAKHAALLAWVLVVPLAMSLVYRPEALRALSLFVPAAASMVILMGLWRLGAGPAADRRRITMAILGAGAQLALGYLALDRSGVLLGLLVRWRNG